MPDPAPTHITIGETLFVFDGDLVLVLGRDGTEATFPVADLEGFVEFLAERLLSPASETMDD